MKGETKEFIRGEKKQRSKSVQKPIAEQEIPVEISGDKKTYNKYFCSDAQILAKTIEKIKDNTGDGKLRATKGAEPEEKWHIFSRKIKLLSGNFLLQTIRAVLKAIKAINDEIDGKKILSLEERAELFQVLDENENIVDFLNQDTEGANDQEEGEKKEEENRRKEEQKKILTDSLIINNNTEDKEMVRKWINSELTFQTKLLYRLTRDGPSIFNFHSKCDYITPTLLLVETQDQNKFGGYTTATWDMFGGIYKNASKTFLFSLNKNKKYYRKSNIKYSGDIFSGERDIGPWFGIHDLYFYGTMKDCFTYKYSGQCLFLDGNGLVEQTSIDNSVPVKEVEVYQIIFKN